MGFIANSRITKLELELRRLRLQILRDRDEAAQPSQSLEAAKANLLKAREPETVVAEEPAFINLDVGGSTDPVKAKIKPKTDGPRKAPLKKDKKPRRSFEEELGARWAVWVGGIALFLGAVFLLRYSIEAGFFTPAMRVALTCLLGTGLLGAGEFLRRADQSGKQVKLMKTEIAKSLSESADIAGVLTAVGIFALLGAAYASHAMYGLIGAIPAFLMMGLLSLTALALGLLHGPKLAALGLVASLATPQLIQSDPPNAYNLFIYLIVVGAAALALAHKRSWGWLNVFTLFGLLGWSFLSMAAASGTGTHYAWLGFLALTYGAGIFIAQDRPIEFGKPELSTIEFGPIAASIWAALASVALIGLAVENNLSQPHFISGLIAALVLMATAWFRPRLSLHIIIGGCLGLYLILLNLNTRVCDPCLYIAGIVTAIYIYLCFTRVDQQNDIIPNDFREQFWPIAALVLPILFTWVLNGVRYGVDNSTVGILFFVLSVVYAAHSFIFKAKASDEKLFVGPVSIYAAGAAIAYVLAVLTGLDGRFETIGLIVGIAGAALAFRYVPDRIMGVISAGFALLTAANVLLFQIPDTGAVGDRIIFNSLWIYLAAPAVICAVASWDLKKHGRDLWTEGLKAMSLVFVSLFAIFQIRHAMNGGELLADRFSLEEMALQVLVGLSFTLGGTLLSAKDVSANSPTYEKLVPSLATGVSLLTLALFAIGICLFKAPLFNGSELISGGIVLNSLLLAYLLPSVLLASIAALSHTKRPETYVKLVGGLSLAGLMFYVTSMVRHGFSGDIISIFRKAPDNAELYTISAVWLVIGIVLLTIGVKTKSQSIRLASAIVIVMTVFKAFFIDMASLEGVLRALSFVVLGLVLIVIGRVYQRLLFSKHASNPVN